MNRPTARIQILNVDLEVKKKAEERARIMGTSLQDLLRIVMYNISEGRIDVGIYPTFKDERLDKENEERLIGLLEKVMAAKDKGEVNESKSAADLFNKLNIGSNENNNYGENFREKTKRNNDNLP